MYPDEKRSRQEKLTKCIYDLSERMLDGEKGEIEQIAQRLTLLYSDGFRHSYADFFPIILEIFNEDNTYDREYLLFNLQEIRNLLENDYSDGKHVYGNVFSQFVKLCEHLDLQISQLTYFRATEDKVNDANANFKNATDDLKEANENLEEANKKANSMQTELIAVLSIFAAIVITFSGGLELLGNAVSAAASDNVNIYRLVLVCLIVGLIFFNTVFLMMYLVAKITDRSIFSYCKSKDCNCEKKNGKPQCSGIKKLRKRLPYVFYFNIFLMLCALSDIIAWKIS